MQKRLNGTFTMEISVYVDVARLVIGINWDIPKQRRNWIIYVICVNSYLLTNYWPSVTSFVAKVWPIALSKQKCLIFIWINNEK